MFCRPHHNTRSPNSKRTNPLLFSTNKTVLIAQESSNLTSLEQRIEVPEPSLALSAVSDASGGVPNSPQDSKLILQPALPINADKIMYLQSHKVSKSKIEAKGEGHLPGTAQDDGIAHVSSVPTSGSQSNASTQSRRRKISRKKHKGDVCFALKVQKRLECHHENDSQHRSYEGRSSFVGEVSTALQRESWKEMLQHDFPGMQDVSLHDSNFLSLSSFHESYRSRSSSPVARRKILMRKLNGFDQHQFCQWSMPTLPSEYAGRSRMCRRSSLPLFSTSKVVTVTKQSSLRRAKSAEKLATEICEAPPIILFPTSKSDKVVDLAITDCRDFSIIRRNAINRQNRKEGDGSLEEVASRSGSIALSMTGSTFASAEIERLKRSIMQRVSFDGSRRPSTGSIGSHSTRDSSVVIAQLELLQRMMTQCEDEISTDDGSVTSFSGVSLETSLAGVGSKRSLKSCDSSLMDAFFDPSTDVPPYLTIFYATQSGTSEYYAYVLQQEGQAMGIDVGICNIVSLMHSIEMSLDQDLKDILIPHTSIAGKKNGRALFLVSTHQNGGPPDGSKSFVEAIRQINDHTYLEGLHYAVFGFGSNSFSATFNSQAKLYDRILSDLGAKRIVPTGLGDDTKDIDCEVEQWKWRSWWPKLADLAAHDDDFAGKASVRTKSSRAQCGRKKIESAEVKFTLEFIPASQYDKNKREYDLISLQSIAKHFLEGAEYSVKSVKPLWRDPELSPKITQMGSTMHVALDLTTAVGAPLNFKTGDNVAILPQNRRSLVEEVAKCLGYDLDAMFILKPQDGSLLCDFELPFPMPCTIRDYLTLYAELTTPPRRSVIRALSKCATKLEERDELYQLSSRKHREMYNRQVIGQRIGLGELISVYYPSVKLQLETLIGLCTPMQLRWYSLSGSTLAHKDEIHLTFSVMSFDRDDSSLVAFGTATHYLSNLPIGSPVRIIRSVPSGLIVPSDPIAPLIMIANGSGIAPMLALIQERHYQRTEMKVKVGPTELFFGIRRRDLDFLYRDELRRYKLAGSLSSLQLACSREQMHKIYVQHLVVKHSEHIWRLLQRGAHIYVCGANSMCTEVDQVICAIVSRHRESNQFSTEEFMADIRKQGRYVHVAFDSGKP